MKILAIDDDPIVLELLAQFIAELGGHRLITAQSADEAIAVLSGPEAVTPDFFLCDIHMPGTNGIALTKHIRHMDAFRDTPILMLTSMSDKSYIDAAFAAGATDYVTKPFDTNDLRGRFALIERCIAARNEFPSRARSVALQPSSFNEPIGLHEPISVFDVENVIEQTAMENYLMQLSRAAIFGSSTFAFAIRDIEKLHDDLNAFEFHSLIEDVAEVISDALNGHQFLMTYSGNGVFVCVTERGWTPDTRQLADRVNLYLSQTELYNNAGDALFVRVSAGRSIRFVWKTGQSVLDAVGQAHQMAEDARTAFAESRLDFWSVSQSA